MPDVGTFRDTRTLLNVLHRCAAQGVADVRMGKKMPRSARNMHGCHL
jgi:hypothetical protein